MPDLCLIYIAFRLDSDSCLNYVVSRLFRACGAGSFCAFAHQTVYAARQNFILLMQLFRFAYRLPPAAKALRPWNPTGKVPAPDT